MEDKSNFTTTKTQSVVYNDAKEKMDIYVTDYSTVDTSGNLRNYMLSKEFKRRFQTLTSKERRYARMMLSRNGVLFLKAKPGVAKSAIARSIAKKLGLRYFDIRLSMADETDMQFPNLVYNDKVGSHVIEHAIPMWSVLSNEKPSLIHFEELNRAPLAVRNAALQILLERGIAPLFNFNDNVIMMASGNLGEEDGTDVDELDSAHNNRLIHVNHDLTIPEWLEWGVDILHPDIQDFMRTKGFDVFEVDPTEDSNTGAYATPRSWHMLSDYIVHNFTNGVLVDDNGEVKLDEDGDPIQGSPGYKYDYKKNELIRDPKGALVRDWGETEQYAREAADDFTCFVGTKAGTAFLRFINERVQISFKDIINNFKRHENDIKNFRNDRFTEMVIIAEGLDMTEWNDKQCDNFIKFLELCQPELRVSFITKLLDESKYQLDGDVNEANVIRMVLAFSDELDRISDTNTSLNTKKK